MIFLWLFFAHLLGDFVLQSNRTARNKAGLNGYMLRHVLMHLLLTAVVLSAYGMETGRPLVGSIVELSLIVACTHLLVDLSKVEIESKVNPDNPVCRLWLFAADQALHVFVLLGVSLVPSGKLMTVHAMASTGFALIEGVPVPLPLPGRFISLAVLLILATRVSGMLVDLLVSPKPHTASVLIETKVTHTATGESVEQHVHPDVRMERVYAESEEPRAKRGMLIGYLERLIVMSLVFGQAYSAIGFIAAAKSLVRFKQLEHREWAEYFLVGTLASMLLGLLCGHLMRSLI